MFRYHIDAQRYKGSDILEITEHGFGSFHYSRRERNTIKRIIRMSALVSPEIFDKYLLRVVPHRTGSAFSCDEKLVSLSEEERRRR